MARWQFTVEAIDPTNTSQRWEVGIPQQLYKGRQIHGHACSLARIILVHEVLSGGTTEIFRGWSRPNKDGCYVYVGFPARDYRSVADHESGWIDTPAPPDMAFLIFVTEDGTIEEWTWRPIDKESGRPQDIEGELIWSQDQT